MVDDPNDRTAALDAFEQAPVMLSVCEGDPLVVTASNAMARAWFGTVGGRAGTGDGTRGGASPWSDLLQQVVSTGEACTARDWSLRTADDQGREVELHLDVVLRPCFSDDGSVSGVTTMAVETAPSSRRRPLPPTTSSREVTTALQDAILPAGLPVTPGAQVAARYLLAQDDAGGDWFDAVALEDGRVLLVVGDVVGHGIGAAVLMGELRAIFDERVRPDGDIAAALEVLDRRAQRHDAARAATVCAAVLDPATGRLRYATAGHPPPLVVDADGRATYLPTSGGPALGAGGPFAVSEHDLAVDDLLLLYSNGLVERAHHEPTRGTVELAELAGQVRTRTLGDGVAVDRWCEQLLHSASRDGYHDDIVLLGLQRTRAVPALDLALPADPTTVGVARAELRRWLTAVGVGGLDETVLQHSVGELVTNAVEHAYADVPPDRRPDCRVRVQVDHLPGGVVEVVVTDQGAWLEPRSATGRGRGLAMVQGFCDELAVEHGPGGTTVRVRHRPRRAAELLVGSGLGPRRSGQVLELVQRDGELVVRGPVDAAGADELRRQLAKHTRGGTQPLLLDLGEATLLSSGGVQAVLDLLRLDRGLRVLAPLGSPAQHVLELARLPYATHRGDQGH